MPTSPSQIKARHVFAFAGEAMAAYAYGNGTCASALLCPATTTFITMLALPGTSHRFHTAGEKPAVLSGKGNLLFCLFVGDEGCTPTIVLDEGNGAPCACEVVAVLVVGEQPDVECTNACLPFILLLVTAGSAMTPWMPQSVRQHGSRQHRL